MSWKLADAARKHTLDSALLCSAAWIDALQRKADEESLVLHKLTSDWQNYSRVLSAIKSNTSGTTQTLRSVQNSVVADHQRIAMSTEVYYDLTQQVSPGDARGSGPLGPVAKLWHRLLPQVMNLQMQLDNVTSFMDEHEENMHDLHYHSR